jgi:HD-GYP domain-containing protein (c-di-GMP phosphodiesterase class II)
MSEQNPNVAVVEKVVRAMVVAIMNAKLYFVEHRRVVEATGEAAEALDDYFSQKPRMVIGLREGLIIFEGRQLYDLSIFAHRIIELIRAHKGWGLCFERGVTAEELRHLAELLLGPESESAALFNLELKHLGVTRLYLEEQAVSERMVVESEASAELTRALDDQQVSREVYTGAMAALQDLMVDLHKDKQVSFATANDMAENLARALQSNPESFVVLTAVKDYDAYTFNHSVNICIFTTTLAESLTTSTEEVVRVAQAALLHDVGKLLVPDTILYKKGRLNEAEWEIMRQHPFLGAKILMEAKGGHELAINAAYGHHIRHDRSGYPDLLDEIELDPITELITVIDVYEAVTAKRPYKKPFPPEKAADLLLKGSGKEFNPVCVELFIRHYGVYPPGTSVLLDNGARGQVIKVNHEDPFRPKVRLTHSPDGESLESEEVVDTADKNAVGEPCLSIREGHF